KNGSAQFLLDEVFDRHRSFLVHCSKQQRIGMGKANKFSHPEIREKVTSSILHLLATLPETHRNIFVWKHYQDWPESQIASRLGCSFADVENTLYEISRTVKQRAEAILLESAKVEENDQLGPPGKIGENALEKLGPLVRAPPAGTV